MKKTFFIVVVAIAFFVNSISAQNIKGFVAAGVNASQIDGDEVYGFEKFGFNGSVGAMIPLEKSQRWNISVETMFSQRGSKGSTSSGDLFNYKVTLPYIEIPVLVHFTDQKGGFTFGAGLSYSRLVGKAEETFRWDTTRFIPQTDLPYLKNDLSVIADIRFTIWRGLKFNVRYQYSIMPIKKDWKFEEIKSITNGVRHTTEYKRNAYSSNLTARLIWVFNDKTPKYKKREQ